MIIRKLRTICLLLAGLFLAPLRSVAQEQLPGIEAFRGDISPIVWTFLNAAQAAQDKTSPPDCGALQQYTYTEKETRTKLDSKGQAQSTETNIYQVTRGVKEWEYYRKLISTNGVAVSNEELAKQDREQKKREEKQKE